MKGLGFRRRPSRGLVRDRRVWICAVVGGLIAFILYMTVSTAIQAERARNRDPNVVQLDYITLRSNNSAHVKYWWNIPFAASAAGANRWRAPQPVDRFGGVKQFNGKEGKCPAIQSSNEELRNKDDVTGQDTPGIDADVTEDCLALHVFTPIDAKKGDNLPVAVDIPGGGFHIPGRANGGPFVAKSRVEKEGKVIDKGVVVVTLYYRVGIYGFLGGEEMHRNGDLNVGLKDQRAGLEWIQKYIREFGGNPNHVVIMGGSAGGGSVMMQLSANGGEMDKPLFHGAIAQSPAAPAFADHDQAQFFWDNVAEGVGCRNMGIDCVRHASTGDLYFQNYPQPFPGRNSPPKWMWAPTIEPSGGMWTEPESSAIIAGRYAKVPTLIGFTTDEGSDQVEYWLNTTGDMLSTIKDSYPLLSDDDLNDLYKTYGQESNLGHDKGLYWEASARAIGDLRYICPTYLASAAFAEHNPSGTQTWLYQWDVAFGDDWNTGMGTKHAGTIGQVMSRPMNEISAYFLSFVKHLDPNVDKYASTPNWPAVAKTEPQRLFFSNRRDHGHLDLSIAGPDTDRDMRCADVKRLLPKLGQ